MAIFEDLFRDYPEDISHIDLKDYIEYHVPNVSLDTLTRFESHAFFTTGRDVRPRFETLRVYFVARWLASRLESTIGGDLDHALTQILERNATGNSDVLDFLVQRFAAMDTNKAIAAISHASKMVRVRDRWEGAASALFHLAQRLAHKRESTRGERTLAVITYLGMDVAHRTFSNLAMQGHMNGLSLAGFVFKNCSFRNAEFRNCVFDGMTRFEKTRFDGILEFENSEGPGKAQLIDCDFSEEAERTWDLKLGRASRRAITESVARDAMRDVLGRFVGAFGFSTIKEVDRKAGAILRNQARDLAWEELIRAEIIVRHTISGVTGGGLHISEDKDLRHEVRNFLDNAAFGPHLGEALERLLKRVG
jgi:Pentapeptide repeats (9 copies)